MPSPITGQATGAGLSTAVALSASQVDCSAFSIKAPLTNSAAVYLGASNVTSATGYQLDPGDELAYERLIQSGQPSYQLRPSDFYIAGSSPDKITWLASP